MANVVPITTRWRNSLAAVMEKGLCDAGHCREHFLDRIPWRVIAPKKTLYARVKRAGAFGEDEFNRDRPTPAL
jgi:hypothetical protein